MPSSHEIKYMLPIQITDFSCRQLRMSCIRCNQLTDFFIISYVPTANRSWLLATFLILHHRRFTRHWAYPTVILHLPSDFALPFDVKSFPQKEWTLNLGKLIAREPFNLDLFASSLSLFPFVVYIIPHFKCNVNIFFQKFHSILFVLNNEKEIRAFAFYSFAWYNISK